MDPVFVVRQMQEKYLARKMLVAFVDLEKALIGFRGKFCGGRCLGVDN